MRGVLRHRSKLIPRLVQQSRSLVLQYNVRPALSSIVTHNRRLQGRCIKELRGRRWSQIARIGLGDGVYPNLECDAHY
jgi:hypothetical protein